MVGQSGNRVLLVDDKPLIRKLISVHLVSAGYVVHTAEDGIDAIGKLRAELPPDLIIADLNMARMPGREFLAVVRKRFPQIPVIATTAEFPNEMLPDVTADAYYYKGGLPLEELLETISDLTKKPPPRAAPPPIDNEPVQARWDKSADYVIDCQDCLREFNFTRTADIIRGEKWTTCVHCGKLVQFFVAEHLEGE